jgi:light-regulated signal transduction histidine kinase (bacteriophytochrome)
MIVEALYSKEDRLGFVILEVPADQAPISNALRSLLSSALQGVLLLQQRRFAEAELLASQRKLESLVMGLEAANQELESFAYSVSHDLRTPLRAVVGYARLLEDDHRDTLNEDAQQMLDRIMQSGRRMGMLIDDLLAFSRIGRQALHRQQVNLNEIVHEVCDDLSPELADRQIEWTIGDLPPANADPGLIRQVYANLIGNAVKYSAQREVARIEVGNQQEHGRDVYYVRDNGVGFDMHYASKIFGVFQRLHAVDEFEGTGIGLAIVHRIITRHGGRIWAEAEVDKGAAFYFEL